MVKRKENIAYHEAGHALSYLLTNRKFRYATIKPNPKENTYGCVVGYGSTKSIKRDLHSYFNPDEFCEFIKYDFCLLAGFIAEKRCSGYYRNIEESYDYKKWVDGTLFKLPVRLSKNYQKFILEYISEVFSLYKNERRIKVIAAALLEKETITYKEILDILKAKYVAI